MNNEIVIDTSMIPDSAARAIGTATLDFIRGLMRDPELRKKLEKKACEEQ